MSEHRKRLARRAREQAEAAEAEGWASPATNDVIALAHALEEAEGEIERLKAENKELKAAIRERRRPRKPKDEETSWRKKHSDFRRKRHESDNRED